ncbi:hypothetical protein BDK51DRAFT_47700 [Blyttiomyces helicus]|uniref:Retrovirus-related Pol polyprotein from transposon TNT 1-94-like beta-barrel domain-containing protein n=1 Tax=Blyttiomyces helicus TaxID=388810 RepID=A0A4V1IQ88_9FUNG|nr:hypothetical protein BDK51DRAFT_47700 [Blyttiomyces helicus]|eukprot:RKO85707.1 hypothetical protein BDK51DRAFT_47700 [Blyttiomyces helicus]
MTSPHPSDTSFTATLESPYAVAEAVCLVTMYTAASPLQFDVRTGSSKDPSRQKSGHCAHDHANSPACKEKNADSCKRSCSVQEMLADSANTNLEMLGADDACGGRSFEDLEQKWLVNSGTTSTMMADRSFFKEYKQISSSLMVGNRCSVHVKGFGPLNTLQLSGGFRHSSNPTAPFNICKSLCALTIAVPKLSLGVIAGIRMDTLLKNDHPDLSDSNGNLLGCALRKGHGSFLYIDTSTPSVRRVCKQS